MPVTPILRYKYEQINTWNEYQIIIFLKQNSRFTAQRLSTNEFNKIEPEGTRESAYLRQVNVYKTVI